MYFYTTLSRSTYFYYELLIYDTVPQIFFSVKPIKLKILSTYLTVLITIIIIFIVIIVIIIINIIIIINVISKTIVSR